VDNPRHLSAKYSQIENPDVDQRPSRTPMRVIEEDRSLTFRLDVLGEGTMDMIVDSDEKTGRLIYKGMKLCRITK
jgi:hypothetical protein